MNCPKSNLSVENAELFDVLLVRNKIILSNFAVIISIQLILAVHV